MKFDYTANELTVLVIASVLVFFWALYWQTGLRLLGVEEAPVASEQGGGRVRGAQCPSRVGAGPGECGTRAEPKQVGQGLESRSQIQ